MRPIPVGESAVLDVVVTPELTVHFEELGSVHPVYATYNMAKHFEEAGRKLLLRHLDPDEDGLGRSVAVEHLAPSWVGDRLRVVARCVEVQGNRITCACSATDGDGREVGRGSTVQVVLTRAVLDAALDPAARFRRPRPSPDSHSVAGSSGAHEDSRSAVAEGVSGPNHDRTTAS